MKEKSIWLRQIALLAVCAFTVSSYGQLKQLKKAGEALTKKPHIGIRQRMPIGTLAFSAASAAQRTPQTHSNIQDLYTPKSLGEKELNDIKSLVAINPKLEKALRKMVEEAKKLKETEYRRFKEVYKNTCEGIEQGRVLRDTLYWIRLYNKAIAFKEDSIAKDCLTRFLYHNPSVPIIVAADSLMPPHDRHAPAIPAVCAELKFYEYWANPDSAAITADDFGTLAALGEKHNSTSFYVNLARGMRDYLNGNCKSASDIFMNLLEHEIEFPHFEPEYKRLLSNITAYTLDCAGRHADMLAFFEKWEDMMLSPGPYYNVELSDLLVTENPYTTFLLYKAALYSTNPQDVAKADKYMDMCNAADAEYFEAQYKQFYNDVYAHFLDNPQYLENLDFIIAGFAPDYMSDNLTLLMADLMDKLPSAPDDGMVEHYYEESLVPYREAILEIARMTDSLHNGQLTPQNAIVQLMAETARVGYLSSAPQGRENLRSLFEQLYKKRKNTEYHLPFVLTGTIYSQILSHRQPKDAAKIMDKILPVMKKYETDGKTLMDDTEYLVEIYEYAADLYRKTNKPKKADRMLRNAANLHTGAVE